MSFVCVRLRTHQVLFDATGFVYGTPTAIFHAAFEKSYINLFRRFCISRAYLNSFLTRLRNLDIGLRAGYFRILHVKGIGFKVFQSLIRSSLYFFLGYNHVTKYKMPDPVSFRPLKGHILLFSVQKAPFGSAIYHIRHLRFPDPYRGKGIRYRFQLIQFKPGKQR